MSIVAELAAVLAASYPTSFEALTPALPPNSDHEAMVWSSLPPLARQLYEVGDGGPELLVQNEEVTLDWLSFEEAVAQRDVLLGLAAKEATVFQESLFPMFCDGSGDFLCLRLDPADEDGVLQPYFHEEPELRKPKSKLTTLLKRTLSAMKKGRWRGGFEGEAGREHREKLCGRYEKALRELAKEKPDIGGVQATVWKLEEADLAEEAVALAEKLLTRAREVGSRVPLGGTLASAQRRLVPELLEQGRFLEAERLAGELLTSYIQDDFDMARARFRALEALRRDEEELREAAGKLDAASRKQGLETRMSEKRGHRVGRATRLRQATDELDVASAWLAVQAEEQAAEAVRRARAIRGAAEYVQQQLVTREELERFADTWAPF